MYLHELAKICAMTRKTRQILHKASVFHKIKLTTHHVTEPKHDHRDCYNFEVTCFSNLLYMKLIEIIDSGLFKYSSVRSAVSAF